MSKIHDFSGGMFCVIRNWMQVFKWSSWDFLSPLILQKVKEDNISQLGNYVNNNTRMGLKSFDQFNTPQTASNFRYLLSCGTI